MSNVTPVVVISVQPAMSDLLGRILHLMDHARVSQLVATTDFNYVLPVSNVLRADGEEAALPEFPEAGARPEGPGPNQVLIQPGGAVGGELAVVDHLLSRLLPHISQPSGSPQEEINRTLVQLLREQASKPKDEDRKRKLREDECPEEDPVLQKWLGVDLLDDGVGTVNAELRSMLRGPFSDPSSWFLGKFKEDKVGPVLGGSIYLRHLMGSDRVHQKTIRMLHSRFAMIELKHFLPANAGVVRSMETETTMAKDEDGDQVFSTKIKWKNVETMHDVMDCVLNRYDVVFACALN